MNALPEHLRAAAAARTEKVVSKAHAAIKKLTATKTQVSFAAVAREAGVSTDFLYRHSELRDQIERHRSKYGRQLAPQPDPGDPAISASSAVRALARKLDEERKAHREAVAQMRKALEVAHGENLELRRRLAIYEPE